MAPAWDELAKEVDGDKSISTTIAKVDCTKHQSVCQEQGVGGYPTIMFFRGGEKVENYRGGRYVNITSQHQIPSLKKSVICLCVYTLFKFRFYSIQTV